MAARKASNPKAKKQGRKQQREAASRAVDQRLVKALANPLRVEVLAILNDRLASPNELSKELQESLSQVSYHVKVLLDLECIELVKTEPRRGATEHFYKAVERVFIPSEMAKAIPSSLQRAMYGDVMADIDQDVSAALKTGQFDKRPDYVVSRVPGNLDNQGCKDAEKAADEFIERFLEIEGEAATRRANGEGGGETIPTTSVVLVFGSVLGKKLKPSKKRDNR